MTAIIKASDKWIYFSSFLHVLTFIRAASLPAAGLREDLMPALAVPRGSPLSDFTSSSPAFYYPQSMELK